MKTMLFPLLLLSTFHIAAYAHESHSFDDEYRVRSGQSQVETLRSLMRAPFPVEFATPKIDTGVHPGSDAEFIRGEYDALHDLYGGNYSAAIEKLLALEVAHPGKRGTAAHLSTAYELAGDNRSALQWFLKGIKCDESSRYGSEWLHKRTLEAKIAMEGDPDYLKDNRILPFDESTVWHADDSAYRLIEALHDQLGERMIFVKPTDPVIADLLYSFAMLEANTQAFGSAAELLQLAREYGYHDTADLEEKLASYRKALWAQRFGQGAKVITSVAALCILFALLYFVARFIVRHLDPILNPTE